jgi:hypothetical protein
VAIRTALLATTAAAEAEAAHTALNREQAGIVVVSAIRRRSIAIPSEISKIKGLIESKPFPKVNGGQKI